ncbi:MAG: hypothetical protein KY445_15890 [Armatimonadetes bacterium]|nr:hypothetical protein [Armatimonadota bacterium]
MSWKPAPEAKSALEICEEICGVHGGFAGALQGQEFKVNPPTHSDREGAKAAVLAATSNYAQILSSLGESDLQAEMATRFGPVPKANGVGFGVVETLHHHGQIVYIQTLRGDTESHFIDMTG